MERLESRPPCLRYRACPSHLARQALTAASALLPHRMGDSSKRGSSAARSISIPGAGVARTDLGRPTRTSSSPSTIRPAHSSGSSRSAGQTLKTKIKDQDKIIDISAGSETARALPFINGVGGRSEAGGRKMVNDLVVQSNGTILLAGDFGRTGRFRSGSGQEDLHLGRQELLRRVRHEADPPPAHFGLGGISFGGRISPTSVNAIATRPPPANIFATRRLPRARWTC